MRHFLRQQGRKKEAKNWKKAPFFAIFLHFFFLREKV